jgi:hypothetical protein
MEVLPENSSQGKSALTDFELIFENENYLLLLAFPHTGRQHQIRAHAAHHGFPLLGDKIYHGGVPLFKRYKDNLTTEEDYLLMQIPRQALHACAIYLPYPDPINPQSFLAPLPDDLTEWISANIEVNLDDLHQKIAALTMNSFAKYRDKIITGRIDGEDDNGDEGEEEKEEE